MSKPSYLQTGLIRVEFCDNGVSDVVHTVVMPRERLIPPGGNTFDATALMLKGVIYVCGNTEHVIPTRDRPREGVDTVVKFYRKNHIDIDTI